MRREKYFSSVRRMVRTVWKLKVNLTQIMVDIWILILLENKLFNPKLELY